MTEPKIQSTINHLLGCHRGCERQILDSLDLGGKHATRQHIAMLTDLSDLSHVTAELLERGSEWEWAEWLCELTGDACVEAADQCEQLGETECAEMCRTAAAACAAMEKRPAQAG
ncbi:hypothetical protein HLB23_40150 [Nocardia uniformis]|uniref:Four-helix bundle copper-binding protein n=1 Tax=Nocardia uniformis TaxID=53432 RepID=A0A849CDR3_9NOCA|nr:hypothetical protein [Nocardia uniformis]NNH75998.1 hypothetical protein [Nocardia uniformis]